MKAPRCALFPVLLTLPDGRRRKGAIKAVDWEAAEVIARRHYPGVTVEPDPDGEAG